MAGIADLLNTIIQKKQLDLQTAAHDLAERQLVEQHREAQVQTATAFGNLASRLAPSQRDALVQSFAAATGTPEDLLHGIAQNISTDPQAQQVTINDELLRPGNPLRSAFMQFQANRLTPGAAAVDTQTAALPVNELQQAAGIAAGTRMGAAQDDASQRGWAQLRQGDREMYNQLQIAGLEAQSRALGAGDHQKATEIAQTLEQLQKLYTTFGTGGQTTTPEMNSLINAQIEVLLQRLKDDGVKYNANAPQGATDLKAPGPFGIIKRIFSSGAQ